jgi:hypothetical protein
VPTKTYLPLVVDPDPESDAILKRTRPLPVFTGREDEHLSCPGCKGNVAQGISARSFEGRYVTPRRLVFQCPCGTFSILPSRIDPNLVEADTPAGLEKIG